MSQIIVVEIPDTVSLTAAKVDAAVTLRFGVSGAYKYIAGGVVKAKVQIAAPAA